MFNFIMSGNAHAWEAGQFMRIDVGRFGEYSGDEWSSRALRDQKVQRRLEGFATLLMYESGCGGPTGALVRYGYVRSVKVLDRQLVFRFDERGHLFRANEKEFFDALGIEAFEQSRTHWAVKEGSIPTEIFDSIIPIPYGSQIAGSTRRAVVDLLLRRPKSFHGEMEVLEFLKRIWDLASLPSTDGRFDNAEADIWHHIIDNYDWDDEYLLNSYLGLLNSTDKVFLKFIETTVLASVGNSKEVMERVQEINSCLQNDGFRLVDTSQNPSHRMFKSTHVGDTSLTEAPAYEIVLSFAGEDRLYVEAVADFLLTQGVSVFYDRNEEASLWGKDLAEHLDAVYRTSARFCVMFISKHYAERIWPNHERKSALARAITERREYILPARFDNTEIPGVRPTLGYVDLTRKTPQELGRVILQKIGRTVRSDE